MRRKHLILVFSVIIALLIGCGSDSNAIKTDSVALMDEVSNINTIKSLIPCKNEIKEDICAYLNISENNTNNSPRKSVSDGNYYFTLSEENISISGNAATTEIQFIFIDELNTENETKFEGSVCYIMAGIENNNSVEWFITSSEVTLHEVNTGNVHGSVKFLDEFISDVRVYGKSGDETTNICITDESGEFSLINLFPGTYEIKIYGENIQEKVIPMIQVEADITTEVGIISILPVSTENSANINGYIFFTSEETEPVENAVVWLEKDNIPYSKPELTNINGYYSLNNIQSGTYEIYAQIEDNISEPVVFNINQENINTTISLNIILPNESPIITSFMPKEETVNIESDSFTDFYVNASDENSDYLIYDWEFTVGTIETSFNTCTFSPDDFTGTCEISVTVKDLKGGKSIHSWTCIVSEN